MTTVLQFKNRARALFQERTARMVLESDLIDWINAGVRDFATRVMWYERIVGQSVTASKGSYSLPSDILKLILLRYQEKYRIEPVDLSKWSAVTFFNVNPVGIPSYACLTPHDTILRLWTPPSSSSLTTTLSGAHNSSVTTLTVASTAGFPSRGYLIVGTEQIYYEKITSTQFQFCRRGDGDTTAGTYVGGETVTEAPLVMTTAAIPPAITADGDTVKFPSAYEDALVDYLTSYGWQAKQDHKKAEFHMGKYLKRREEAALEKFWDMQDGTPAVKDEEYDMGWYGQA